MKAVKPSGRWRVPWIEALPDSWELLSAKRLFQTRADLAPVDEPQLAATQAYGVIEQAEYERRVGRKVTKLNKNLDKRRLVKRDDFVISMRSFEGGLERAWAEGGIRSSYIVLKPVAEIGVGYYQHLFKSQPYIQALRATGNFIRDGQDLNFSNFSLVDLPYPPMEDQALIARYLDWHGAMTGRLIRAKRGILALIAEQREVVTREALEHRETKEVRFGRVADCVFREVDRTAASQLVAIGLFNRGRGIFQKPALEGDELGQSTFSWVQDGDLIFSGQFAWEGAVAVAGPNEHGCIASHRYHIVQGDDCQATNTYLWCLFRSSFGQMVLNEHSRGAAGRNRPLNINSLMKGDIPVANEVYQQKLHHLVQQERRLAQEIADEITLIQEFRARLIADVVTGQLDVRAVAATLPDITEIEAADDLTDDDDLDEEVDDLADAEEAA